MAFPKPIDGSKLPLDTKGDLIVFGKKNERLPVGTNGQVLTADSAQTLGVKWAAPVSYPNLIDVPPASPSTWDDEFGGASLDAKWSWLNQGTSSAAVANGRLLLTAQAANGTRGLMQTAPAGDCVITTRCTYYGTATNYSQAGLLLYNSGNSKLIQFGFDRRVTGPWGVRYQRFTNVTTFSADSATWTYVGLHPLYFKIEISSGSISAYISPDGDVWMLVYTETIAAFLGAISHIGVFVNDNSALVTSARFDWFRVVE